jgi:DNA repair protein RadC
MSDKSQRVLPREKLLEKGVSSLKDEELLAIVLGKGNSQKDVFSLSRELMEYIYHSSRELAVEDLLRIKGIGLAKACQVLAAIEFSGRYLTKSKTVCIRGVKDAIPLLVSLKKATQEEFAVITLDGAQQVIHVHFVTKGLVNKTQIHPREVFRPAIQDNAVGILVAHNHPSGALRPSKADLKITKRLYESGRTVGIDLLDHIIVTKTGYLSLLEQYPELFTNQ